MKKNEYNFIQFLSLIIQQSYYLINDKNPVHNLRFCETKFSRKHGHDICITQVRGKSIYPEFTANEIIHNPQLLCEFSKEDIVLITKIAMQIEHKKIKRAYSICEIPLRKNINNEYIVQQVGNKNYQSINLSTIAENIDLLEKFSPTDTYNFGYEIGVKEMRELSQKMRDAKEKTKSKRHILNKIKKLFLINVS